MVNHDDGSRTTNLSDGGSSGRSISLGAGGIIGFVATFARRSCWTNDPEALLLICLCGQKSIVSHKQLPPCCRADPQTRRCLESGKRNQCQASMTISELTPCGNYPDYGSKYQPRSSQRHHATLYFYRGRCLRHIARLSASCPYFATNKRYAAYVTDNS